MHGLAMVFYKVEQYAQAQALFESCLERRKAVLGEDHPDTFSSEQSVVLVCEAMQQPMDRSTRTRRRSDISVASMPEARAVGATTPVTATLVEDDNSATAELQKQMKAKEEFLLEQLAQKDAQLRATDAELRKMETRSSISSETLTTGEFGKLRTLQKDEVRLGRLLAAGNFNSLHAVKGIVLDDQSYRWVPREHIQRIQELASLSKNTKLVVKAPKANLDPKKQSLASKRLIYEAKLVVKCSHHNLISIVGMASIDVVDTSFFYLMHRIEQTLFECITKTWNKRQRGKPNF
jgi:hypothetical protein